MFSTEYEPTSVEADAMLPTKFGEFRMRAFYDESSDKEHALLYTGEKSSLVPLVRIHSECLTGDAFSSLKCDCGSQLEESMKEIQKHGSGAIVYLRQEGRGIGLYAKIQAYALQEQGFDTLDANLELGFPADARTYDFAAVMLSSIGFNEVDLMTNNPEKIHQLNESGIEVKSRVPIIIETCEYNRSYLKTKSTRMGHLLRV
jgi:GTP cyclohydrolase II|tara:strand:- start:184 stop:789 length:606 start_codon:yes stop_codon:yes gene_type:complete